MKRPISAALFSAISSLSACLIIVFAFNGSEAMIDHNNPLWHGKFIQALLSVKLSDWSHSATATTASSSCKTKFHQLPIVGESITSVFGYRIHPIFHRRIFHEGVDFTAHLGEKVICVLDGVVQTAGRCPGFGNVVTVYHPTSKTTSMYAHLSRIVVKPGQIVQQGCTIGCAGSTGFSTGVHLHFGVKSADGKWQDPLAFLRKVPGYELLATSQRGDRNGNANVQIAHFEPSGAAVLKRQNSAAAVFANHRAIALSSICFALCGPQT